jgi:hypothetical protein
VTEKNLELKNSGIEKDLPRRHGGHGEEKGLEIAIIIPEFLSSRLNSVDRLGSQR